MKQVMHQKSAYFLGGLSIILLIISLWGLYVDPYRNYKEKYQLRSAAALYKEMDESFYRHGPSEMFLLDFVENIGSVIKYDWPDDIEYMPIQENWILYLLRFVDPLVSKYLLNDPKIRLFGKVELPDYKHAFSRGFGVCSQLSLATADFLHSRYGIDARVAGLNGHVTVQIRGFKGGGIIVDPSFGFLSFGDVMHPESIDLPFLAKINRNDKLYLTADDNYLAEDAGWSAYSKRSPEKQLFLFYFTYFSYYLKWLFPVLGLAFFLFSLKRTKVIGSVCAD
jgi:hypothetical protein